MQQDSPKPGSLIFQGTASIRADCFLDIKRSTALNWMMVILLTLSSLALLPVTSGQAAALKDPPGPDRVTALRVNYTAYTWWMATWNKNQVVCSIVVDHDDQPTLGEVYTNCDPTIYYTWENHSWYKLPQESVVHHDPQRWNRR